MKYLLIAVPISILFGAWLGFSYAKFSNFAVIQKQEAYYKERVDILQKEMISIESACEKKVADTIENIKKNKGK